MYKKKFSVLNETDAYVLSIFKTQRHLEYCDKLSLLEV